MLKSLSYSWRLFATGLSFSIFGIGGIILGLIVFPIMTLIPAQELVRRKRIRSCVGLAFKLFFWMMHYLGLLRYRVFNRDILKADHSCLVVANHPSLIDVVSLISLYPNACCIIKQKLWENPFMGRVLQAAGYIPNDSAELIQRCADSVARGDVLIIFPEGTRTVEGQEMQLQRGAAHIALRLKCPIRTIQIRLEPSALTKELPWYTVTSRRVDFTVTPQVVLQVDEYLDGTTPMSLAARRLTKKIRENIDIGLVQSTIV